MFKLKAKEQVTPIIRMMLMPSAWDNLGLTRDCVTARKWAIRWQRVRGLNSLQTMSIMQVTPNYDGMTEEGFNDHWLTMILYGPNVCAHGKVDTVGWLIKVSVLVNNIQWWDLHQFQSNISCYRACKKTREDLLCLSAGNLFHSGQSNFISLESVIKF